MFHTTPNDITDEVLDFCRMITTKHDPVFLDVTPQGNSVSRFCFGSVDARVAAQGGQRIVGWAIWYRPGVFIEAENHAVWENPNGELIDITPVPSGEKRVLFVRDDEATPYGNIGRNNRRRALTDDALVKKWVRASDWENHLRVQASRGVPVSEQAGMDARMKMQTAEIAVRKKYGDL